MQLKSAVRYGRRQLWLPALALAGVAVAGCSSSGGATAAPPPTTPAAAASTPGAPAPTAATAPGSSASAPAPASTGAPTAAPAGRPADACTLLQSPQVVAAVGTSGPFRGTHPDPASDGSPVWGCTWGSPDSYASVRETTPTALASAKADGQLQVTTLPGVGQEAVLTQRKDGTHPRALFVAGGRVYAVEVVKDRGPGDGVNAPAEALAESGLAMVLAKSLGG
ncbi:hypothetical protein ACFWA9_17220 [Kitasatospora sp. NPDC059973]|uniref:hypothetical protein n=1 Tax=Kitasatospora sp. NPDC059973 TaxID=3347020 RepID=UPI00367DEB58